MVTQTSDSQYTWRKSRKHTRRKLGERTKQLEIISAPSTGRMSSVPTSTPTSRRIISATAKAPERWWEDQLNVTYAEWVQLCLPKHLWTWPKISSGCTNLSTEWHHERQSLNGIMRDSWDNYQEMMTEHSDQDHGWMTTNGDWIRRLSEAFYRRNRLECLPNSLPKWMPNDHTGGL